MMINQKILVMYHGGNITNPNSSVLAVLSDLRILSVYVSGARLKKFNSFRISKGCQLRPFKEYSHLGSNQLFLNKQPVTTDMLFCCALNFKCSYSCILLPCTFTSERYSMPVSRSPSNTFGSKPSKVEGNRF